MLIASAIGVGVAAAQPAAKPKTLAYADSPVVSFAQEANRVGWIGTKNCLGAVRVRNLAAKTQKVLGHAAEGDCLLLQEARLALAGPRALWSYREVGNMFYAYLAVAGVTANPRLVGMNVWDKGPYGIGDHLGALAGGGGQLVWSKVDVSVRGADDCDLTETCRPYIKGGSVYRVVGARSFKIAGTPPAVLLAADSTRFALLPAGIGGQTPRAKRDARVEVRTLPRGSLVSRFSAAAPPEALAIQGQNVAVLTKNTVELRSLAGALLWKKTVPPAATGLSLSPLGIVYRVHTSIRRFDLTGLPSQVAVAKTAPIGLAAVGHRVAWGENVRLQGKPAARIQAVELSR